jgi:membrane associated rhomboid family serine protease
MSSPNNSPIPPNNPILNAYEQFVRDTPLVTRYVLTTLLVTWFAGFFVDLSYATATVPYFCLYRFEIYRVIISPFICQSILSLVFAVFSFTDNGKRLEFSMGSTAFGWYLLTMACCTNIAFLMILFLAYGLSGDSGFLWYRSIGIWTILFGLIATECSKAPRDSQRRLFFFNVPTIYFPIALWGLFALFGGVDFADLLSVGVGYASGYGYLDKLKLKLSRFNQWEETILSNFTQRPGWVVGHAATGDDAWSTENNSGGVSIFLLSKLLRLSFYKLLTFSQISIYIFLYRVLALVSFQQHRRINNNSNNKRRQQDLHHLVECQHRPTQPFRPREDGPWEVHQQLQDQRDGALRTIRPKHELPCWKRQRNGPPT